MTPRHSNDDRHAHDVETLCALFDGELQGDAARFATKRLGHDAQWRQACGRWQLYGDVLRGQAQGVAAGGFADRVALAIAREPQLQQAVAEPARATAGMRRGWIGGALAASVAVAALFVTRPFSDEPTPSATGAAPQVATATAPAAPVAPAIPRTPVAPAQRTPDRSLELGAAAVAAAVEVPRRAADRRASRGQSQRAALRARQNPTPAIARAAAVAAGAAVADATLPLTTPSRPFQPQHVDTATTRPWPRAVLPQYSGGSNGITASFGTGVASESPSFYPFEPQPADEAPAAPADEPLRR